MVNNAGICDHYWFDDLTGENFRRLTNHHFFGTVYVCQAAWPHLQKADHPCIVNTSSEAIWETCPRPSPTAPPRVQCSPSREPLRSMGGASASG